MIQRSNSIDTNHTIIDRTCTNEKNQHTTFKKVAKILNYKNNNNRTVYSSKIRCRNRLKPICSLLNGRVVMNIYGLCSLVARENKGNE